MAEPQIIPPLVTINQTDSPEEVAHTIENVQKIFDKIAPHKGEKPAPEPAPPPPPREPPPVSEPAPATGAATEPPPPQESTPPESTPEPTRLPSFIEKALAVTPSQGETTPAEPSPPVTEELPEEPPVFKTPEESKQNWRQFREKYNALKKEAESLRSRPAGDPQITEKLSYLEKQNQELNTQLQRTGIERNRIFQEKIIQPMTAAWQEAARVMQETGRNPQDLAKALSLSGNAQYEALDELFSGMPETAKIEAVEHVRNYRHYDNQRRRELANAPQTAKALHKAELEQQYQQVEEQRTEMKRLWEEAGRKLREAKVEVFLKSSDPDAKWWNDQADSLEETSRRLFLENTDMEKVAIAMRLAPSVDIYRKLWLATKAELAKKDAIIKDKFGSEPTLSESGGNVRGSSGNMEEQLKRPFTDVFLEEFHRQRAGGR